MNKFHSKETDIPWRTLMPGVYIRTLRHVENKFAIHMLKVEAGLTEAPETIDADQYVYVLRGKAESHIGDEKVVIGPGDTSRSRPIRSTRCGCWKVWSWLP